MEKSDWSDIRGVQPDLALQRYNRHRATHATMRQPAERDRRPEKCILFTAETLP